MSDVKFIDQVLKDLYAADPALKGKEKELRALISELLSSRPDVPFDPAFAATLREEVLKRFRTAPSKPAFLRLPAWSLALPAVGVAALVLAVMTTLQPSGVPTTSSVADLGLAPGAPAGLTMRTLGDGAFGALAVAPAGAERTQSGGGGSLALGLGGGGGLSSAVPAPAVDKMLIAPDYQPINYRYVYKGETLDIPSDVAVVRRVKSLGRPALPASFLGGLGLPMDLSTFESVGVQNFYLVEDREFGYGISVDLLEGAVSLNQNYPRWPHPEQSCRDEECFKRYRLSPEQVPGDEAIVATADRFLADKGIDRSVYGAPIVQQEWRAQLAAGVDRSMIYVPDAVSVIYPYVIDGKTLYDEGGTPNGLSVSVNVRHMRVDGMWGLVTNVYESSRYPSETDAKRILGIVERGGLYGWSDPAAKVVEVEVGAPQTIYTRTWVSRDDGTGEELFVPALMFPVLKAPEGEQYFRKAVVVPLAKDVIDGQSPPVIMPLEKPVSDVVR